MNHILRAIFLLSILLQSAVAWGRTSPEYAHAVADRQLYLTGERVHLTVSITDSLGQPSPLSRVVYVELSDRHHTCAQTMVALTDGSGWADLPLDSTLHSGYYLLSVYTRAMLPMLSDGSVPSSTSLAATATSSPLHTQLLPIVNPLRVSRADDVLYLPLDSLKMTGDLPAGYSADSIYSNSKAVSAAGSSLAIRPLASSHLLPEPEGHIVQARPVDETVTIAQSRLVMIGRSTAVFDGQRQSDGSWLYFTSDIYGRRPALLTASDPEGHTVAMQFCSPFAGIIPLSLPRLRVYCSETALLHRTRQAQREQAITRWLAADSIAFTSQILSSSPHFSYDLDEYTRFSSVRQILTEFVHGIKREHLHGVNLLFTYDPDQLAYSTWPALVLLDGMPIVDVDQILDYDARLLRYVQVYTDRFTFGGAVCGGIISFTSRRGLLSNYQLDASTRLITYSFPQDHPVQYQLTDE